MATYSHSRISTFEQCRYKYKLQYIDKVKVDIPTTIEAFMGDMVHKTLQKLYSDLKFSKLLTLSEMLNYYYASWEENFDDKILIVKKEYTSENYLLMGVIYLTDYYNRYQPFDNMKIIGLETQDMMTLPDGNHYHVRIDKLGCKDDVYYICDYKTNSSMKSQRDADSDRQLAMYSLWVKDRYKDAKDVVLLWHMLAFNKDVISKRTETELQKLLNETIRLINNIEECKDFPTNVTKLCDYCVFQSICPAWGHKQKIEQKSLTDFKSDEGVKLVDELSNYEVAYKELELKINDLKERLINFSKHENVSVIYGSDKKASIKESYSIEYPEDKKKLISLIKEKGLFDEYAVLNYIKLNSKILKSEIDKEILDIIKKKKDYKVSISKK